MKKKGNVFKRGFNRVRRLMRMKRWIFKSLYALVLIVLFVFVVFWGMKHGISTLLKDYYIVLSIFGFLLGGFMMLSYFEQKREEAKYGFYVNLKAYLTQMLSNKDVLESDNANLSLIFRLFATEACCERNDILENKPRPDVSEHFKALCDNIFVFFSTSKDIVPPSSQKKQKEQWYKDLFKIIEFVQLGKTYPHCAKYESYQELLKFYKNVYDSVVRTDQSINELLDIENE